MNLHDTIKKVLYIIFREIPLEAFGLYYSVYAATVEDNRDPDNRGRIKLNIPDVWAEPADIWAEPAFMPGGSQKGFILIPDKGDNVRVIFKGGNPRFPLWVYAAIPVKDQFPPEIYGGDNSPKRTLWLSAKGNFIALEDKDEFIRLQNIGGIVVDLNDGISLGSPGTSSEPAVLGNKNADVLENLRKDLGDLTTQVQNINTLLNTYFSGSAPGLTTLAGTGNPVAVILAPLTAPLVAGLPLAGSNLTTISADITGITPKIPQTKSTIVTLD